jgi:putative phosphoesterase
VGQTRAAEGRRGLLLGIMSDSHGRADRVRQARQMLECAGAEVLFHCGDVGGLEVLDELIGCRVYFVWGNMDSPSDAWRQYVESVGLRWPEVPLIVELAGRRIAVCHGHEPVFARAVESGQYDYVLYGHTHAGSDHRVGRTRLINPGALHRARLRTVALLDLARDALSIRRLR